MPEIFINLKRFDVPRALGGICPSENAKEWSESVIEDCVSLGLGNVPDTNVTFLFPEGLVLAAAQKLATFPEADTAGIKVGCQGIFRDDVAEGANFGAFTTNLPAAAAKGLGCTWAIVGHSEERKDKLGILAAFEPGTESDEGLRNRAGATVNKLINAEVLCALDRGISVLLCMGETADERGGGTFDDQKPRIEAVLKSQVELNLAGVAGKLDGLDVVIGYEPIWAIGPGKTPPDGEYIAFVSDFIKKTAQELYGVDPVVVYGGGLKVDNAKMIAGVDTIGGGLVALTKFTPPIAFEPKGLKEIIDEYLQQ